MTAAKKFGGFLFGAAAIAACTLNPFPADAAELPAPEFHTVLWEITSPNDDVFFTPQVYVATLESDNTSHWITDAALKCGTRYQADAYVPSAVAALIADSLLHGGEDNGIAHHWLVFTTAACAPVIPPIEPPVVVPPVVVPPVVIPEIPTPELPAEPVPPAPVDTTPTPVVPAPAEPVVTPPVAPVPPVPEAVAETPAVSTPAPVAETRAVVAAEQVAAKQDVPVLAATGVDMATPTGVAFLLILGGIILWSTRFFGKRANK